MPDYRVIGARDGEIIAVEFDAPNLAAAEDEALGLALERWRLDPVDYTDFAELAAASDGLTVEEIEAELFSDVIRRRAVNNTPLMDKLVEQARAELVREEGQLEVDDISVVSADSDAEIAEAGGAYVLAWYWAPYDIGANS